MKIHPMGASLFHADGWTDGQTDGHRQTDGHDKANSCFSQFCEHA